jgi:hypothetical protein
VAGQGQALRTPGQGQALRARGVLEQARSQATSSGPESFRPRAIRAVSRMPLIRESSGPLAPAVFPRLTPAACGRPVTPVVSRGLAIPAASRVPVTPGLSRGPVTPVASRSPRIPAVSGTRRPWPAADRWRPSRRPRSSPAARPPAPAVSAVRASADRVPRERREDPGGRSRSRYREPGRPAACMTSYGNCLTTIHSKQSRTTRGPRRPDRLPGRSSPPGRHRVIPVRARSRGCRVIRAPARRPGCPVRNLSCLTRKPGCRVRSVRCLARRPGFRARSVS